MKYSNAELLDDIRELEASLGHQPSLQEYRDHGSYSATTYYNRFGSWQAAVEAAGLEPEPPQDTVNKTDLLAALRDLAPDSDTPPTATEMDNNGPYWVSTYQDKFGSWTSALEAAGFDADASQHRSSPTKAALLEELHRLTDELGSPPSSREMDSHGKYGSRTYARRFGSWNDALAAADIEVNKSTPRISDQALIEELQRLRAEIGTKPTSTDVAENGTYAVATYQRRFGSWSAALTMAFEEH